jgi:hypothetical protein
MNTCITCMALITFKLLHLISRGSKNVPRWHPPFTCPSNGSENFLHYRVLDGPTAPESTNRDPFDDCIPSLVVPRVPGRPVANL